MKLIFSTLFSLFTAVAALGQGMQYPTGAYMSFEEIKQKSPGRLVELEVERRTNGDIKMNGGNDYKLLKSDKSISKNTIKKEYYAYSDGDSLYINGIHYKIQTWYASVLSDGKFLVIKGGISMVPKIQKEQLDNKEQLGFMLGPLGGAIQGAKLAMLRFIYVIDKETNQITTVSSKKLKELLSSNPELLEQYEAEEEKNDQKVFVKYLKLLNEQ
jgi:hypothetical protein